MNVLTIYLIWQKGLLVLKMPITFPAMVSKAFQDIHVYRLSVAMSQNGLRSSVLPLGTQDQSFTPKNYNFLEFQLNILSDAPI